MATLSEEDVRRIGVLARLRLTDSDVKLYQNDLGKILSAFEKLCSVSLPQEMSSNHRSGWLAAGLNGNDDSSSHLRTDTPENSIGVQSVMQAAPEREGPFVRVPSILDRMT